MASVQGTVKEHFEAVRNQLQKNIDEGEELGASIYVNVDGEPVLDIFGGFKDVDRTQPWTEDTIVNVWSCTKMVSALAVLILHDRGLLDVNENVSKYWPEFGVNGKEDIKVYHLLSHTSGVSGWDQPVVAKDIYDVKKSTEALAKQAPWWTPGTAKGYHTTTYGHLLGELVRRLTGKSLTQFVKEEIAGPAGADFQIGASELDWGRVSDVTPPPPFPFDLSTMDRKNLTYKTMAGPWLEPTEANTPAWRRAEIGAANGHGNARALGRIFSQVTTGKLLLPSTVEQIFSERVDGVDIVTGSSVRFGTGYALGGGSTNDQVSFLPKDQKLAFWGGWGGSFVLMDFDRKATIAYVMNKMSAGALGSANTAQYFKAIYEALER